MLNIPPHIASILRLLENNGYAAYLVGGCVRDVYMNRTPHDWDIATSAQTDAVSSLFEKTVMTGENYGTVTVITHGGKAEVTTFRADGSYRDGRHPENVEYVSSIITDLGRRDFTCNAMAVSMTGTLTDPFNGLTDIKNRVLRCVGSPDVRFSEDSLRMLRAFRFSAELGFEIEPDTAAAILRQADRVSLISAERIRDELGKTLLSPRPEIVTDMIDTGLIDAFVFHAQTLNLTHLSSLCVDATLRWCAFCVALTEAGAISDAGTFLKKLRLDNKTVKTCSVVTEISGSGFPVDRAEIKRLLSKNNILTVRCAAAICDAQCGGALLKTVDEIVDSGECFSIDSLAVRGGDLLEQGHKQGKAIGETLNQLLEHVIDNPPDNSRELLLSRTFNKSSKNLR